jgi:hypothetical protein
LPGWRGDLLSDPWAAHMTTEEIIATCRVGQMASLRHGWPTPGALMERSFNRERQLPAFSLNIGELEALWSHLTELFADPATIRARIEIRLPSQHLQFANLEELKQFPHLPSRITNFEIWLSQEERYLMIAPRWRSGYRARISTIAETEAWCAGAMVSGTDLEKVHPLLAEHPNTLVIGWQGAVSTLILVWYANDRLLPPAAARSSSHL